MGENLLCPSCNKGPLKWQDLDHRDLESATMVCQSCGASYVGIPGWDRAMRAKASERAERDMGFLSKYHNTWLEDAQKKSDALTKERFEKALLEDEAKQERRKHLRKVRFRK